MTGAHLETSITPGTGDVQMGPARLLPQSEMIIVTTPSKVAQKVASRVASMARSSYLRIAGVVENMSSFTTPAGERFELFGEGGGQLLAWTPGAHIDVLLGGTVRQYSLCGPPGRRIDYRIAVRRIADESSVSSLFD